MICSPSSRLLTASIVPRPTTYWPSAASWIRSGPAGDLDAIGKSDRVGGLPVLELDHVGTHRREEIEGHADSRGGVEPEAGVAVLAVAVLEMTQVPEVVVIRAASFGEAVTQLPKHPGYVGRPAGEVQVEGGSRHGPSFRA